MWNSWCTTNAMWVICNGSASGRRAWCGPGAAASAAPACCGSMIWLMMSKHYIVSLGGDRRGTSVWQCRAGRDCRHTVSPLSSSSTKHAPRTIMKKASCLWKRAGPATKLPDADITKKTCSQSTSLCVGVICVLSHHQLCAIRRAELCKQYFVRDLEEAAHSLLRSGGRWMVQPSRGSARACCEAL